MTDRHRTSLKQQQGQIAHADEDEKERKVIDQKFDDILPRLTGHHAAVSVEGDEARERRNRRAQPARVHRDEESGVIFRELGQKHRRRHVGDDLAGENADGERVLFDERAQRLLDGGDARKVAREHEEGAEGEKKGIVDVDKGAPVEDEERQNDGEQPPIVGEDAEDDEKREREQEPVDDGTPDGGRLLRHAF